MILSQPAHRDRVPIGLRTVFYVTLFLATMFGGGAWLFYQLDVHFPEIHFELGAWRFAGAILFLMALFSFLGCTWVLMRNGKGAIAEFDPPSQLVQVGPYRWVRNPVTICVAFMLLGEALALSSTGMLLGMFLAAVMAKLQSLLEERLLPQRFGEEYRQYRARVPRWIPRRPSEPPMQIETPLGT
jgi:protein-S-isoprenylcysteine O-methyltransferase Ste14